MDVLSGLSNGRTFSYSLTADFLPLLSNLSRSQKTMLLIEEKGIPINIELVPMRSYGDKPTSFTKVCE